VQHKVMGWHNDRLANGGGAYIGAGIAEGRCAATAWVRETSDDSIFDVAIMAKVNAARGCGRGAAARTTCTLLFVLLYPLSGGSSASRSRVHNRATIHGCRNGCRNRSVRGAILAVKKVCGVLGLSNVNALRCGLIGATVQAGDANRKVGPRIVATCFIAGG
jgi:hypothetical protein